MKDYGWYTAKCWPELLAADFKFWLRMWWKYEVRRVLRKVKKFFCQPRRF